jgi:tRNA U34 5-methylaminomethyl-2-thiouridine-forming methyltransferase MnmC
MIQLTSDGSHTLFSERYGVTYHSRFGAVTESMHVFINAGLRFKAAVQNHVDVLETGFGTGLNAFLTLLEAERRNLTVRYTGLETNPVSEAQALTLNYAEQLGVPERNRDLLQMHTAAWGESVPFAPHFFFEKLALPIQDFQAKEAFDVVYFDAFAPQAQPELWTEEVFSHMYDALRPEGILVTYCAQGAFKRTLKKVGFSVERLQGPPGKREMTRAWKNVS